MADPSPSTSPSSPKITANLFKTVGDKFMQRSSTFSVGLEGLHNSVGSQVPDESFGTVEAIYEDIDHLLCNWVHDPILERRFNVRRFTISQREKCSKALQYARSVITMCHGLCGGNSNDTCAIYKKDVLILGHGVEQAVPLIDLCNDMKIEFDRFKTRLSMKSLNPNKDMISTHFGFVRGPFMPSIFLSAS